MLSEYFGETERWNEKVLQTAHAPFLQSWEWGEFQKSLRRNVFRFVLDEEYLQVIEQQLLLGARYWYIPRFKISDSFLQEVLKNAQEEKVIFVRLEPVESRIKNQELRTVRDVQPSTTLLFNLSQSEERLFAGMKEKTRYNIRLAGRKGVTVSKKWGSAITKDDLEIFWKLIRQTYERHAIRSHSKEYYRLLIDAFHDSAGIYIAYQGDVPIAANLLIACGDTLTYMHGGSSHNCREYMASYVLQWEVILWARVNGYRWYDFWGIAPRIKNQESRIKNTYPYDTHHPLAGVTRFKLGFGGQIKEYPGTFDVVLDARKYLLYSWGRKIRRALS